MKSITEVVLAALDREVKQGRSIYGIAQEIAVSQPGLRGVHIGRTTPSGQIIDKLARRYGLVLSGFDEFEAFIGSKQECENIGEDIGSATHDGTGGYVYRYKDREIVVEDTLTWSEVPDWYMPAGRYYWQAPDGSSHSYDSLPEIERFIFAWLQNHAIE